MMYPKVLTELETLALLMQGKSIARYGDGELKLCIGGTCIFQEFDKTLSDKLSWILKYGHKKCVIGIPRPQSLPFEKQAFWRKYSEAKFTGLYDSSKTYGSAFITRPDNAPCINTEAYFDWVKDIWKGRSVVVVHGDDDRSRFDKEDSLFAGASDVTRIIGPRANAWEQYDSLYQQCLSHAKESVYILGLGPTATIMAYELAETGRQALDLGHLGMFYRRFINAQV